jgi:hypothetical protein
VSSPGCLPSAGISAREVHGARTDKPTQTGLQHLVLLLSLLLHPRDPTLHCVHPYLQPRIFGAGRLSLGMDHCEHADPICGFEYGGAVLEYADGWRAILCLCCAGARGLGSVRCLGKRYRSGRRL